MTTEYQSMIEHGQAIHRRYVQQAETYRQMTTARASRGVESVRVLERLGRQLIELGRRLCERRGVVAVDVAFHRTSDPGNGHAA